MLELKNVYFSYNPHTPVIENVSLTVYPGEFLGIAGRNGSGKTTITRLIMALKKPVQGTIFFQGNNLHQAEPATMARHIGYVFQNPDRQIFHDTVAGEAAYGPRQIGYTPERTRSLVQEALDITGLSHLAGAYPLSLSKGQKQRLAIASALAMQPEILILDEPASGQDAKERQHLLELLITLNRKGTAMLLITHDMEFLAACAQRTIVMVKGHKVFDGTTDALFQNTEQLADWGLIEPVALHISRRLSAFSLPPTVSVSELASSLIKVLGKEPLPCLK